MLIAHVCRRNYVYNKSFIASKPVSVGDIVYDVAKICTCLQCSDEIKKLQCVDADFSHILLVGKE